MWLCKIKLWSLYNLIHTLIQNNFVVLKGNPWNLCKVCGWWLSLLLVVSHYLSTQLYLQSTKFSLHLLHTSGAWLLVIFGFINRWKVLWLKHWHVKPFIKMNPYWTESNWHFSQFLWVISRHGRGCLWFSRHRIA